MGTLDIHEKAIDAAYLRINLPPTAQFFATVKALYIIRDHKLYKQRNKSFEAYLQDKWDLKRALGNRLCMAGHVITTLEKTFNEDELPSNATLCIAVDAFAKKQKTTMDAVWKAALEHFGGRDNAVACQFSKIFEEPITPTSPPPDEQRKDSAIEIEDEESEESEESETPLVLRKRKAASSSEDEAESTSDEDEEEHATETATSKRFNPGSYLSTSIRNVFNTPGWLCDLIESFTKGVDLDPCSNPTSKIKAKVKYGYAEDGSFINALTIDNWEPNSNWVYLNPPGVATSHEEKTHGCNLHRPFWTKCFAELEKGNIKRVIALIPTRTYATWCTDIWSRALTCCLSKRVLFEKPDGTSYDTDVFSRTLCYLDTDDSYPYADRFVQIFRSYGYIPNVSMRAYKPFVQDLPLRYFSLCAGIGVAEQAIHSVYRNAFCVGFSEIDPEAIKIYEKHFPEHENYENALNIKAADLPDFDLLIAGIPCQPFSQQSVKRKHFEDERSKLFACFLDILEVKSPKDFLLENVPMAEEPRLEITKALGVDPVELNANVWTAQNRKRLYWCSWYIPPPLKRPSPTLKDIMEAEPKSAASARFKDLPDAPTDAICSVNRNTATSTCKLRTDGKSNTLTCTNCYQTVVAINGKWRHYTIKERERLQGLPDGYTECDGVTHIAKQRLLGNAMTLPVIEYLIKQL
ncbi:hypothetical protein HDU87_002487 [Geranomyces variabilis]|uniref:DNA (cytosine-5-)-methyltransferase n=1 Tax=Geranomyces variabilis TaxID=109894 RepID=A0AAD5XN38_9FUNG|nr:hypothetical protein HDU87_002487 [Geranomyces variabilis]